MNTKVANASRANDNARLGPCAPYASGTQLAMKGSDSCALPPGDYDFTSFTLGGHAALQMTGPIRIHHAGPGAFAITGGGFVNDSIHTTWLEISSRARLARS